MVKTYLLIMLITSVMTLLIRFIFERLFSSYGSVKIDLTEEKNVMTFDLKDEPETINSMKYLRLKVIPDAKKTDS